MVILLSKFHRNWTATQKSLGNALQKSVIFCSVERSFREDKMRRAIGYIRVSTASQANEGISLEAQEEKVRAWAVANGYDAVRIHRDAGISGCRTGNRPALRAAIEEACENQAALVVYSLSRLARSTRDALEISDRLSKAGADLVSITEKIDTTSAAGKMVFRMLAVLSEFETDLLSERTSMALAHLKKQGRKTGGYVPYGYDVSDDGYLVADPLEQEVISLIKELRYQGMSLRRIAAELNGRGLKSKRGGKWYPQSVSNILNRDAA